MTDRSFARFHGKGIVERRPLTGRAHLTGGDPWARVQVSFAGTSRTVVGYGAMAELISTLEVGDEICVAGAEPIEPEVWRRRRDGKICTSKDVRADSIHVLGTTAAA